MEDELRKRKLLVIGLAIAILIIFGYGFYAVMGRVSSAKEAYLTTYKELVKLEQNQKEAELLQKELSKTSGEQEEVMQALLAQTYEDKLKLVIQFENIAKNTGLEYDLQILKELTGESIAEEKTRLERSRRKTQEDEGEKAVLEEKFPSIIFSLKIKGDYTSAVRFFEKLWALPYYINIDNFNITRQIVPGENVYGGVEVTAQITVFTR
jgi:Tfp pilus assembly protein PilO